MDANKPESALLTAGSGNLCSQYGLYVRNALIYNFSHLFHNFTMTAFHNILFAFFCSEKSEPFFLQRQKGDGHILKHLAERSGLPVVIGKKVPLFRKSQTAIGRINNPLQAVQSVRAVFGDEFLSSWILYSWRICLPRGAAAYVPSMAFMSELL